MKFKINKIEGTYKKAMDNIVDDLKNNGQVVINAWMILFLMVEFYQAMDI